MPGSVPGDSGTNGSKPLGPIHAWGHRARPLGTRCLVLGDAGLGVWGCGAVPACPGLMQLRCPAGVQSSPSSIEGRSPAPAPSTRPQPHCHPETTAAPDLPLHAHRQEGAEPPHGPGAGPAVPSPAASAPEIPRARGGAEHIPAGPMQGSQPGPLLGTPLALFWGVPTGPAPLRIEAPQHWPVLGRFC